MCYGLAAHRVELKKLSSNVGYPNYDHHWASDQSNNHAKYSFHGLWPLTIIGQSNNHAAEDQNHRWPIQ